MFETDGLGQTQSQSSLERYLVLYKSIEAMDDYRLKQLRQPTMSAFFRELLKMSSGIEDVADFYVRLIRCHRMKVL